jgi:RNA polymerase sigma-70 factor (ECF subfamily)
VYAFAAYRLGDGPDAEDVTSETLERALRYRASYDPSKGEPIVWLLGIARRCIAEEHGRRAGAGTPGPEPAAPGDLAEDTARKLMLAAALSKLAPAQRELVALRYGADLSARQIGVLLGRRTNTVEVGLHRTVALLRSLLEHEELPAADGVALQGP